MRLKPAEGKYACLLIGLIGMAAGSFFLSIMPATLGISGYIAPIAVITGGYGLFQTAILRVIAKSNRS